MEKEHTCRGFQEAKYSGYGHAITDISRCTSEWAGNVRTDVMPFWEMGNGEYGTYPIYYCPFCGTKLP